MRIADRAGVTHAGRKRRRNEDAFVLEPPLFAVADGMGGAQAGEIASRLAAASFREYHEADTLAGEERLAAIIKEANRRIYDRAHADAQASGMGTTATAALVDADGVAIGHVGDSRAYRIRHGGLEQLTEDHSLVADLVRSGRLAPEEADSHPQRSVITRALGTDRDVDVDTRTVTPEPGDVFLLCSDGLTTMLRDDEILRVVADSRDLGSAGQELVKAANRRGGEDNVTVVLFSLEPSDVPREEDRTPEPEARAEADDLEDTLTGLEPLSSTAPLETPVAVPEEPGFGWAAEKERADEPPPKRTSRWRRRVVASLVALALVAILLLVALWGLANTHFVGAEGDGRVAVYQGLPYDLGGGVSLYRARYVSRLRAAQLSQRERAALFDHELTGYDGARERIAGYEAEASP